MAKFSPSTRAALAKAAALWKPPPRIRPSEWIERNVVLPSDEAAVPGRYSFRRHAFLRRIADAFADPACQVVVVQKGGQVGWTTLFCGLVGYFIACDPSRVLVVQPSREDGEIWSKDRFEPVAQASPAIAERVRPARSRDGNNRILHKKFAGGALKITGAISARGLASWPAKRALLDEVDRYNLSAGDEGDPILLVRKRLQTYLRRGGKLGLGSTPDLEQSSIICAWYERGDRRRYRVPCHHCGGTLEPDFFEHVWKQCPKDEAGKEVPGLATFVCEHCGGEWTDEDRLRNVERAETTEGCGWEATGPAGPVWSFNIPGLLSPDVTHAELATLWSECKSDEERQVFHNTSLGLPFKTRRDTPTWEALYARAQRETWPADRLPVGCLMLSAGVDVQKDRLECRVWGWGRDRQAWLLQTFVWPGATDRPDVWRKLDELLEETWTAPSGVEVQLEVLAIDNQYATEEVHAWASRHRGSTRVMVVRGRDSGPLVANPHVVEVNRRGKRAKVGLRVQTINVADCKDYLYRKLWLEPPAEGEGFPHGYVHLSDRVTPQELRQLTAEEWVPPRRGAGRGSWQKKRGERNEALDCFNYAFVAAYVAGFQGTQARRWDRLEQELLPRGDEAPASPPAAPAVPAPGTTPVRGSWAGRPGGGWLGRR